MKFQFHIFQIPGPKREFVDVGKDGVPQEVLREVQNAVAYGDAAASPRAHQRQILGYPDSRYPEHFIFLCGDSHLCPGFFRALTTEYFDLLGKSSAPIWLSPRILPRVTDPVIGNLFAQQAGIATNEYGFVSSAPFSNPPTTDGHALSVFLTSRQALREALEGDDAAYKGSVIPAIDLGLRALMRGHRNLLSWTACIEHEQHPDELESDTREFVRVWGQKVYEAWKSGAIWRELRR